ncbi:MAG: NADH-quinone oxidoreductase subunit NuoE [Wolbachia endosymbiont of Menacanthus eurysternus]|nr:MAG: NADH-quinone oxidoreductase subunit NuoE [Wolbachia endosymbiont of Menacanthus eurysternus]
MKAKRKKFSFTLENLKKVKKFIKMYPNGKSAIMPLLYLVQEQCGWVSESAMQYVADMLHIPHIYVYEVASFYTMYNLKPVGKYLIQVCRTTPCWLCNSEDVLNAFKKKLGINIGESTKDNMFSLKEVECLGACVNAPVVQINDSYYENLTSERVGDILVRLQKMDSKEKKFL